MEKKEVVIVGAVRSPIGKAGGSLKSVQSEEMASQIIKAVLERAKMKPEDVEEVIMGEVRQTSQASNVARFAALRAGIPETTPAFTVNRLCASAMQAVASGVQQILTGQAASVIAGGTENMSEAPLYLRNARFDGGQPKIVDSNLEVGQQPQEMYGSKLNMGMTAENVAEKYNISREDQDAFAYESQRRAKVAIEQGTFADEIAPIEVKGRKSTTTFSVDEHPRDTSIEKLATLKPAFREGGTVTAGNACGRNDGAAALVLMSRERADELGLKPLAKIVDWSTAALSPETMGVGPVPALEKLWERTGKSVDDVDLFELNEAFASQSLAVIREAGLPSEKVNVNGGAIALGHPLGATGVRIMTTLLYEMLRSKKKTGVATLCIGGGQGMAIMIEAV